MPLVKVGDEHYKLSEKDYWKIGLEETDARINFRIVCGCGSEFMSFGIVQHQKTMKHQKWKYENYLKSKNVDLKK